jgi:AP2-like factor (ANT lineage)
MATTVHPHSPDSTATTTITTPPLPPPPPPQENQPSPADGPDPAAVSGSGGGGEIPALDQHLAVADGAGVAEEGKAAPGGGKLVAEAARKYAAPRSSRFHGVTRWANPS